jgi:hypothetical protein
MTAQNKAQLFQTTLRLRDVLAGGIFAVSQNVVEAAPKTGT